MKKFKNEFGVVSDSEALLKAFKEEVEKLGWTYDPTFTLWNDINLTKYKCLYFANNRCSDELKQNHFSISSPYKNTQYLPQDWNRALELAAELEEEIPEYVEAVRNLTGITKGKIYPYVNNRVIDGTFNNYRLMPSEGYEYFTPSTKEAYEAQQNKELLEKLIKESGLKIGDTIKTLTLGDIGIIKEFYLINSSESAEKRSYSVQKEWEKTYKPFLAIKFDNSSLPVNKVEKLPETKTLTLGSSNIEIKISKGSIKAQGKEVPYDYIEELVWTMQNNSKGQNPFDWSGYCDWKITFPSVKIGCSTFTVAELEQIVETYNELNK